MHLSPHSLRQIDDAYLQSLEVEALRGLSMGSGAPCSRAEGRSWAMQRATQGGVAAGAGAWTTGAVGAWAADGGGGVGLFLPGSNSDRRRLLVALGPVLRREERR